MQIHFCILVQSVTQLTLDYGASIFSPIAKGWY
jgi:hypothetical protein